MRRRDILVSATGALVGLSGCVNSGFDRFAASGDADLESNETVPSNDGTGGEEPSETIEIGDPEEVPFLSAHPPHTLELRNESDADRTVTVEITAGGDDIDVPSVLGNESEWVEDIGLGDESSLENESGSGDRGDGNETADVNDEDDEHEGDDDDDEIFERDLEIQTGETIELVLVEPRSYRMTVTADAPDDGGESTAISTVDRQRLDCTRSRTTVILRENGIETRSTSETISCPKPEVVDASLAVRERSCADRTDGDAATVEFADEAVVVDGAITIPTPCHRVTLAEPEYDERRDRLAITVGVGDQEPGNCVECLGVADYEVQVDLEGRYPDTVAVHHETRGEDRRITTAEYPPADSRQRQG